MANPHSFFRRAAPVCFALAAGLVSTAPASAQYLGPWGGGWGGAFGPPPRVYGPPPAMLDDGRIPPRVVAGILRAQGYRLVSAPRFYGENIIAFGEDAGGRRARFVIDAYDGDLLQMSHAGLAAPALGRNFPPADVALGAPVDIDRGRLDDGGLPDPMIDRMPNAQKPHKSAPRVKTATRTQIDHKGQVDRRKVAPSIPSQATGIPKTPSPQTQAPPAEAAVAPAAPGTPLAPDASPQPKPADIGPRVQPVPVEARAPVAPQTDPVIAAPPITAPEPAPATPVAPAPDPTP